MNNELSFQLLNELRLRLKQTAMSFLECGEILCRIKAEKLYPKGHFVTYITENVGLGKSTISDMMRSHKIFHAQIKANEALQTIGPTKLRRLLPYAEDATDEQITDMLYDAAELSESDLMDSLREKDGKVTQGDCTHTGYMEVIRKCQRCKKIVSHTKDEVEKEGLKKLPKEKAPRLSDPENLVKNSQVDLFPVPDVWIRYDSTSTPYSTEAPVPDEVQPK